MAQRKTATKTKTSAGKAGKAASHKVKASGGKTAATTERSHRGDETVTIDRRRSARRTDETKPTSTAPTRLERRAKVSRRRQIDPTTCERDYTDDEVQFMSALDDYKRTSGRMFPTCSEVLEVVRSLGYVRLSPSELAARVPEQTGILVEVLSETAEDAEETTDGWEL
jgi:hypothetical protein